MKPTTLLCRHHNALNTAQRKTDFYKELTTVKYHNCPFGDFLQTTPAVHLKEKSPQQVSVIGSESIH